MNEEQKTNLRNKIVECEIPGERMKLVDELIKLLDKQDVDPAHFRIDERDVEKTHDAGAFSLSKAGGYMHYMTKGGYHMFVPSNYENLYNMMDLWLDSISNLEGKPQEMVDDINRLSDFLSSLLFSPTVIFADEEFMFKTFDLVTGFTQTLMERYSSGIMPQDSEDNKAYEEAIKSLDALSADIENFPEQEE